MSNQTNNQTTINCYCTCKKYYKKNDNISFALPCNHMFHTECIKGKKECIICKNKIIKILDEKTIQSSNKYKQYQNDISAVKFDNSAVINYSLLPLGLTNLAAFINRTVLIETGKDFMNSLDFFLKMGNIKINLIDNTKNSKFYLKNGEFKFKDKNQNNINTVFISNHSHYIDSFILHYIFRCGFVTSDAINKTDIGKLVASKCNLLIFKR